MPSTNGPAFTTTSPNYETMTPLRLAREKLARGDLARGDLARWGSQGGSSQDGARKGGPREGDLAIGTSQEKREPRNSFFGQTRSDFL